MNACKREIDTRGASGNCEESVCVRHNILVTQKATNTHINLSVEFSFLSAFLIVRIGLLVLPLNLVDREISE